MGIIKAVCISSKRGTQKQDVKTAILKEDYGIEGDAHAGKWHRQVSLLSYEKAETFRQQGAEIGKECHSHCEIYMKMGDCIMPWEGGQSDTRRKCFGRS